MAVSRILMSTDELIAEAKTLNSAADQNDLVIQKFDSIVNGLLSQWTGDAQKQFVTSYQSKKKVFQDMTKLMHELAKDITTFAHKIGGKELDYAAKAKSLG